MSKRTATKTKPQDGTLFGEALAPTAPASKPIAKATPAKPEPRAKATVVALRKDTPANTLAVIAQALQDPKFNPQSMQIVVDLHMKMVAEQARLEFTAALRELKRKLPTINKDGKIEYKDKGAGKPKPVLFASFENIHKVTSPLLDQFGFDLWFSSEPGLPGMINVIGHLDHENGHARTSVLPLPRDDSGGKSGAQGWASAFSFGKRVTAIGLLNILTQAPVDRDTDGNRPKATKGGGPQTIDGDVVTEAGVVTEELCSQAQIDKVRESIEWCTVPLKTFLGHFEIEKLAQLPVSDFDAAMSACRSFAEKKGIK